MNRKYLGLISVIIVFVIVFFILTFPLVIRFNKSIPGFFSTEESFDSLWDNWRIKFSWSNDFSLKYPKFIAYPFGIDLYASRYVSFLWTILIYSLSLLTSYILAFNIQILLNLFLSYLFTYLMVFYIIRDRKIAIFSGVAFTFCPYQFSRVWQHLGLTYNQWIPLALFAAIRLKESYSGKNRVLFFLSLLLAFSFDLSVTYFTAIAILAFVVYILFYNWKIKVFKQKELFKTDLKYLREITMVGSVAFIMLSPQFLPIFRNMISRLPSSVADVHVASAWNFYLRPFEDLFAQSARPLSYFLPASFHPIFGKFTEQFVGSSLYGVSFTEHVLYLGWVPMILAFVAFRKWMKNRKTRGQFLGNVDSHFTRENFYIGFFIFLAIVAWFFSQPPWWQIGSILRIYMPSFFMYKILPMYRAYCRFGIVLMLTVAVLAGFGLKFILERFKSNLSRTLITALFCALVLFEFWNYPPFKVIDVSKAPKVYYWLKAQPGDFAIAEYPLDYKSPNEMYKFYQITHEKKIINGSIPGTHANKIAQTITKLSDPATAGVLKWLGVKYAIVHTQPYEETGQIEWIEEFDKIPKNPKMKLVKTFEPQVCPQKGIMCTQETGPIDVYEINSEPIEPKLD